MKKILRSIAVAATFALSVALSAILFGLWRFNRLVRRDVETLLGQARSGPEEVVTEDMLRDLPAPVQRYLRYTGVVGKPLVRSVHLKQQGRMHLSADQGWMPLDAEQFYSVQPPGFVWNATMHLGPLPLARGRDLYREGQGNMLIKAGSLFTVVDGTGAEIDQGSMMRYLSEMIWFPSAFLADNVSFEPLDDRSARVTLTDHGCSVTGTMYFDAEGRLTDFVAQRYRMVDGGYELATWSTPVIEYGELAGLKLPVRGQAVWKLPEGDLEYIDVTITELEYNIGDLQ